VTTRPGRGDIQWLFVDIGGVLLTDGWDQRARRRAAKSFKLSWTEFQERHALVFDTYEEGKLTLEEYLDHAVFHQKRAFTRAQFRRFMFAQSKPYPRMIDLVGRLRVELGLKIAVVSNEARELNAHRIRTFHLSDVVDVFVSSCFVKLRKPDPDIFRLALDLAQALPRHVLYLENTSMFIHIAESLGIRGILHTGYASTCGQLAKLGLRLEAPALAIDQPAPRARKAATK